MRSIISFLAVSIIAASVGLNAYATGLDKSKINENFNNISQVKIAQINNSDINSELREMLRDIKYQLLSAQDEITRLQEANYNLKKIVNENQTKFVSSTQKTASLEEKTTALEEKAALLEQKAVSLEQKTAALEQDKQILLLDLQQKQSQIQELTMISNQKINENIKLNTSRTKELENLISEYQTKINELSNQTSQKNTIIEEKDVAINEMEKNLAYYKEKAQNYSTEIESLKNSILMKNQEIATNKESSQACLKEINNIQKVETPKVEIPKTEEIYTKAIELAKENKTDAATMYYNLAKAYYEYKDYSHAVEEYNLLLDTNPDFDKAYKELGIIYAETNDYENSVKNFKKYLKYVNNTEEYQIIQNIISKIERVI